MRCLASEVHSFDMFSLGVLALHLTIGRTEARDLWLDAFPAGFLLQHTWDILTAPD